ncbi:MAG: RNA 2',3'-cyclic phosphodiesterase [Phycisphaerales bacterium]|nr:RNA 2',3'-cyclic phosphodiesterase [Phycisphaerales bacterium]
MSADARLRLFVAAYPPAETAATMLQELDRLDLPRYRPTPAEQVHLTLQFIGDRSTHELDEVRESVERSAAGLHGFELKPSRLTALPQRGPARLVACETDAPPELLEIHRRLAHRLARNPREHGGDRFLPHFTLCRFAAPARIRLSQPLALPAFRIDAVLLMRSVLMPDRAKHREVARIPLPARG